jgi:hypothetical protein
VTLRKLTLESPVSILRRVSRALRDLLGGEAEDHAPAAHVLAELGDLAIGPVSRHCLFLPPMTSVEVR